MKLVVWYQGYGGQDDRPIASPASVRQPDFQIHLYDNGIVELHYGEMYDDDWYSPSGIFGMGIRIPETPGDPDTDLDVVELDNVNFYIDDFSWPFDYDGPGDPTYFRNRGYRITFPETIEDYSTAFWEAIDYRPHTGGTWIDVPDPGLPLAMNGIDGPDPHAPASYPITLPQPISLGAAGSTADWWIGWDGAITALPTEGEEPRNSDYGFLFDSPGATTNTGVIIAAMLAQVVYYGTASDGSLLELTDLSSEDQVRIPEHPVRYQIVWPPTINIV